MSSEFPDPPIRPAAVSQCSHAGYGVSLEVCVDLYTRLHSVDNKLDRILKILTPLQNVGAKPFDSRDDS